VWQQWYEDRPGIDFLAVAVDAQGLAAARPWVERAAATFPVAVDEANALGTALGYTFVSTGIFIDDHGAVRHLQVGDFDVRDEKTVALLERFLAGDVDVLAELNAKPAERPSPLEQELVDAKLRLAIELLEHERKEEALAELDRALELDPENNVIRKQRWYIRQPERFESEMDLDWQKGQLALERETEARPRQRDGGRAGCSIPEE